MAKKTTGRVRKNRVAVGSGLGELEADIMSVVWKIGSASVKDVFAEIYPERRLAYTTIMTVMSRLANKGVLKQDRSGTAYIYTPNVNREDMANNMISNVIDKVLGGNPAPAILFLLSKSGLAASNIDKIKKTLKLKDGELVKS
ncbi:MAG: CopY family transcriptional regulator [Candidatus Aquicultor secundus]|uniref:CopY family transcriptional regulator n=1 Tax=Candidatus Aquicultor secundus TaxID=1973895 RepID=A0A2M7T9H2_9ACTN|nr:BlaI/MecI/CopY family transcriptional regulator [Candidatus Aquicultor secundus]NCO66868.1 BlaI/MecI/CopY family transcriptional regulator [Solirubrobacter sp.]OIO88101.1 MAG: hypothetical protein AUK32_02260 [Candidatus Aquicultor secundus]PIU26228.1 MAG: CopY family transcriptional regulator [Candidatus Aquicultor secundus]PIW22167.1 MAG: CopY family transcriptional regulator [Candidatus Aquicultor secundus]PIX51567.1 MAG: CopY family transcriptional regulator [Candidatus Aquicultor secun